MPREVRPQGAIRVLGSCLAFAVKAGQDTTNVTHMQPCEYQFPRTRFHCRRGAVIEELLGGVVKLYIRMDSSRWDPTPVGAVRNLSIQTYIVSWPLDRQPWAEFLVQRGPFQVAAGSGLGGASPHPAAVGPDGLEPPGTATDLRVA